MKEFLLVLISFVSGYYFRELCKMGSQLLGESPDNTRTEVLEVEIGSFTYGMNIRLINDFFYYHDVNKPEGGEVEISEERTVIRFISPSDFRTVIRGIIGQAKKRELTTYWVQIGILTLSKVRFDLYDGEEKFEYSPKANDEGEVFGFYNRMYRKKAKISGRYDFVYLRNGKPSAYEEVFDEINKSNNDLDCEKFFSEMPLDNEAYFDPMTVRESRSALKRFSTRIARGQFTGLLKYYLEHPEMGLKHVN